MDYAQVCHLNVFSVFRKLPRLTSKFVIYVHPSAGHMVQLDSYRRDFVIFMYVKLLKIFLKIHVRIISDKNNRSCL
jgi:hypothetical protein